MTTTCTDGLFSSEKRPFFVSLSRAWCEQVWAEHKYLVMLSSLRAYKEIAEAFKQRIEAARAAKDRDWTGFADELLQRLEEARYAPREEENARHVLSHAFGRLRGQLSAEESGRWHVLLSHDWREAYRRLFLLAMERGDECLKRSRLFAPGAPLGRVWLRVRGRDWFVSRENGEWKVLSAEQVREQVTDCKVAKLVAYRLFAQLDDLTNPLDAYELCYSPHMEERKEFAR